MLHVAFIGKINQTNNIISDVLRAHFEAHLQFYAPEEIFIQSNFPDKNQFDIIIFDLNSSSGYGNAPGNIKTLRVHFPATPILALHQYNNMKLVQPLIEAGTNGVISITPPEQELVKAVHELQNAKVYISPPKKNV